MAFAIKSRDCDPLAKTFAFTAQKTMYGGKHITEGDTVSCSRARNEGRARPRRARRCHFRRSDRGRSAALPANAACKPLHQTHCVAKRPAGAERA